jgi:hypothetical protein
MAAHKISAVGLDRAALEGLRQMILAGGARQLAVGDLHAGRQHASWEYEDDGGLQLYETTLTILRKRL